jgi:hypothetical protein
VNLDGRIKKLEGVLGAVPPPDDDRQRRLALLRRLPLDVVRTILESAERTAGAAGPPMPRLIALSELDLQAELKAKIQAVADGGQWHD